MERDHNIATDNASLLGDIIVRIHTVSHGSRIKLIMYYMVVGIPMIHNSITCMLSLETRLREGERLLSHPFLHPGLEQAIHIFCCYEVGMAESVCIAMRRGCNVCRDLVCVLFGDLAIPMSLHF